MSVSKNPAKKVLVLSHDVAGKSMAGPGIRYVSVANELCKHFDTTLGLLNGTNAQKEELSKAYDFPVEPFSKKDYRDLFNKADYIFAQWLSPEMLRFAREKKKQIIFDLYAPVPIEFLLFRYFSEAGFSKLEEQEFRGVLETYKQYVRLGDFFVCSNERQRNLWIGFFLAHGLLTERPASYTDVDKLIGIAPMGISEKPPKHTKKVLRSILPGIGSDSFILLWTGGLWDWLEPLKVVQAAERASQKNPRVKLVFMGTHHPNKKMRNMSETKKTIAYVQRQELEGKCVFFIDGWLPYEERVNYLLEADAAIYAHKKSLETRFSHRSRILDHIYAGLPTIATAGDYLADEVIGRQGLGIVTDDSVTSLSDAILRLASNNGQLEEMTNSIASIKNGFTWQVTTAAIVDYIRNHEPQSSIRTFEGQSDGSLPSRVQKGLFFLRRVARRLRSYVR